MSTPTETSDGQLLELLRTKGAMSISEVATATEVTATAVRQRLTRLIGQGMVARDVTRSGRGRPSHRYSLTDKARRQVGTNFADLAIVLWNELRRSPTPRFVAACSSGWPRAWLGCTPVRCRDRRQTNGWSR